MAGKQITGRVTEPAMPRKKGPEHVGAFSVW
jgi:hypothetical protein